MWVLFVLIGQSERGRKWTVPMSQSGQWSQKWTVLSQRWRLRTIVNFRTFGTTLTPSDRSFLPKTVHFGLDPVDLKQRLWLMDDKYRSVNPSLVTQYAYSLESKSYLGPFCHISYVELKCWISYVNFSQSSNYLVLTRYFDCSIQYVIIFFLEISKPFLL